MGQSNEIQRADTVVVIDVETTGLYPEQGSRVIEIGAVRIKEGVVTDEFQQLMNPGVRIEPPAEEITGITNAMLREAPGSSQVMEQFLDFLGDYNLVAHNASFDQKFLDAELKLKINRTYAGAFVCSMEAARRVYPDAPMHTLHKLAAFTGISTDGLSPRPVMADAQLSARLWLKMLDEITVRHEIPNPSFKLMRKLSRKPKHKVRGFLNKQGHRVA